MLSTDISKALPTGESVRILKDNSPEKADVKTGPAERNESAAGGGEVPAGTRPADETKLVSEAVTHLKDAVQNIQRNLEFSVDENSGRTVIKVIDSETGEIIRQIPPEDVFAMLRNRNSGAGILVETRA